MQTRALETLVRIGQVNSFSEAAQLQNMTLSALSMQMKALEAELDADLFDRSFRPPRLTPLGRHVAEQAKEVISAVNGLQDLGSAGSSALRGVFQLGFIQSASARILPKFIKTAQLREPQAAFRYRSNLSEILTEQVASGQIDAAIVTQVAGSGHGLHADLIASEPMALAIPAGSAGLSIQQMTGNLTFIQFRPSTGIGRLIAASIDANRIAPGETLVLDSIEACMECVKQGAGYTMLPLPDIERYADPRVHIEHGACDGLTRDLVMLTRTDPQSQRWRPKLLTLVLAAT